MMLHPAKKLVIITEKLILQDICEIIDACGASGYTIVSAGGKGSRNMRATSERASVVDDFANVKIEIIINEQAMAQNIMDRVVKDYFQNYSGIMYLEPVEIMRPFKFGATTKQD